MNETLRDFLRTCERLAAAPPAGAVLATLVEASGGAAGRRAWILPGGAAHGNVTLGGCAEHALRRLAAEVRAAGGARTVTVELGSGDELDRALTCAGQARLRLAPASPADPLWPWLARERDAGRGAVLLTPLSGDAPTVALSERGEVSPGGVLTPAQRDAAGKAWEAGEAGVWGEGAAQTLCEPWPAPGLLLIAGSGPVAAPLTRLARTLDLRVLVSDDRPERLTPARLPDAHALLAVPTGQELPLPALGPRDAVVVISHDYAHEASVLSRVLQGRAGYVALVASRRRGAALLDFLRHTGVNPAQLARVRTPAGLDLGLQSPAGIALSVLSELVAYQQGGEGGALGR